jgi:hypothetical protein
MTDLTSKVWQRVADLTGGNRKFEDLGKEPILTCLAVLDMYKNYSILSTGRRANHDAVDIVMKLIAEVFENE